MLLVRPPTRTILLDALHQVLDGRLTRDALLSWYKAVQAEHGAAGLGPREGYWYFRSLVFLDVPIVTAEGPTLFLRDEDLEEYVLDLEEVSATETCGPVRRLRGHQIDMSALRWPLTAFRYSISGELAERGLPSVRGTFEERGDMVEHTHLRFRNSVYLIVRQFDEFADQGMVLGTDRDPEKLEAFLEVLDIEPQFFQ